MGKILAVATHATDDQTKSTAAFVTAIGALGAGKEVGIVLFGEAVYLAKKEVAKSVHGVGFPPLPELIDQVVEGGVPVYVWGACSVARGVTEDDLKTLNASFIDPIKFVNLVAESNVVSFWWRGSLYKMDHKPTTAETWCFVERIKQTAPPNISFKRTDGEVEVSGDSTANALNQWAALRPALRQHTTEPARAMYRGCGEEVSVNKPKSMTDS